MLLNKNNRKMRHPYVKLAIFGLAATGAASIVNMSKRFIQNKKDNIAGMINGMKKEQPDM